MPNEDDRFGDVAEQLKRTDDAAGADEVIVEETRDPADKESTASAGADDEDETPSESTESEGATGDDVADGPPFAFDETSMHGFYVREETWDRVTHARSSVTAACSMFDVPEFEGREFQDACLRVVADHADEIALRILEERDVTADEERVAEVVAMLRGEPDD